MRKLVVYYILILAPIVLSVVAYRFNYINSNVFLGSFLFYALVYRTYVDGKKLADKNIIAKKDIWKLIIPGSRIEHFKELYLK